MLHWLGSVARRKMSALVKVVRHNNERELRLALSNDISCAVVRTNDIVCEKSMNAATTSGVLGLARNPLSVCRSDYSRRNEQKVSAVIKTLWSDAVLVRIVHECFCKVTFH